MISSGFEPDTVVTFLSQLAGYSIIKLNRTNRLLIRIEGMLARVLFRVLPINLEVTLTLATQCFIKMRKPEFYDNVNLKLLDNYFSNFF